MISDRSDRWPLWRVYHCWSSAGDLLYVGVTVDWRKRRNNHACKSPWWGDVDNVTLSERMAFRPAAALERRSIRDEAPLHNRFHNRSRFVLTGPLRTGGQFRPVTEAGE